MAKKLNKTELIKVLVDEYGYEKSDLKDTDGKLFTNAKLEMIIKEEETDAVELENLEKEGDTFAFSAKDSKFKDDDMIMVMNGLNGSLTHRSLSTGRVWRFKEFGQIQKIPYSEILSIRYLSAKVFDDGWLVILNKQIQDDFELTEKYKNILTPDNIEEIFNKDVKELEKFVENLPKGMKVSFISKARELHSDRKIEKLSVLEFIQTKFGISLDDNAPLSDYSIKKKD